MELVLGTAGIAAPYGVLRRHAERGCVEEWPLSFRDLHRKGFSAIDTAPVYGDAEDVIGSAGVVIPIHTKLSPALHPIRSLEQSLVRLRRSRVSVVYFHDTLVMDESQVERLAVLASARGELYEELGASIYDEIEFDRALAVPQIDVIQVPSNVLDRRFGNARLDAARNAGKRVIARSVFLQGTLISDIDRLPLALSTLAPSIAMFREICEAWATSPILAALGYVRQKDRLSGITVGAKCPEEAFQLAELFAEPVPSGLLQDLESLPTPSWEMTDPRTWRAL